MKFKTIAEAFNYWNTKTAKEIETRAAEIKEIIEKDANADIAALNIEIDGMKQAKANIEQRSQKQQPDIDGLALITGRTVESRTAENRSGELRSAVSVFDTAEYRSAFFKSLLGQELTQQENSVMNRAKVESRAAVFMSSTDEAAIIPTQTMNEIIKKARTQGGLLAVCRSFNMPSKIAIPVGTPSSKAAWHTEGAAVDGEKNIPATVVFDGYEIMKVFSISAKTKTMTIQAFESYLVDELATCVMETIADSLVNGTGSSQGTGILNTEGTTKTTYTKAGVTYKDLVAIVAKLKRGYSAGAVWAMNNATLYGHIYSLVDSTGRPVFIADPRGEDISKILGFGIVVDDNIPDGTLIFGNFRYMGYNMPEGIAVEKSTQSSFKSGLIDYRAMAIADTKCIVPEAFVIATAAEA